MFVRFLDGLARVLRDEAGESNQGGGGETPAPKMIPQDQANALIAKEKRTWQAKIAEYEERLKELDSIKSEFEKVREEKELAGKTAAEKLEHKHTTEMARLQKQLEELRGGITERDARVKQAETTLSEERLGRSIVDELGKAKVLSQSLGKAARLARLDISEPQFADGKWVATYGDLIDKPIGEVIAAWAKDNPEFLPAPAGGAGTRAPNGVQSPKNLWDLEPTDLLAIDARQRAGR
jgi:hypothetical protein